MRKSQFIFVLMLSTSFATMARADGTSSYDNCATAVGASNCVPIGDSGTYYALSGDEGNQTMTIYGTKGSESNAAIVPENAFYDYDSEESTVPGDVTSLKTSGNVDIGDYAFLGATNLTSVDLTDVQSIGIYAFADATGLTSVDLTGVQTIGEGAFWGPESLTSIDLTGVETIGASAFRNDTGLTSANLTGVQTIGNEAFFGVTGLTSIVISDSLLDSNGNITGIYANAFAGSGLNTIYWPEGNACENSFEGVSPDTIPYSKDENGTYSITQDGITSYFSSPEKMVAGTTCNNNDGTCASEAAQYKAQKAQSMAGGTLCTTQHECLNLMNMVADSDYTCTTIAACSAYAKDPQNNITLASLYPQSGGTGGNEVQPQKPARKSMLIYTIDEANQVAGKVNSVKIRYR